MIRRTLLAVVLVVLLIAGLLLAAQWAATSGLLVSVLESISR